MLKCTSLITFNRSPLAIKDTTPLQQQCIGKFGGPSFAFVAMGGFDLASKLRKRGNLECQLVYVLSCLNSVLKQVSNNYCCSVSKVPYPPIQSLAYQWGKTGYVFGNLSCGQVNLMAIVIGLHGSVCVPNNTGRVTFMSNLSCCLVKIFVHMTHCCCN